MAVSRHRAPVSPASLLALLRLTKQPNAVSRELRERDCRIVLVAPAFGGAPDDAQFTAVVDALFSAADR